MKKTIIFLIIFIFTFHTSPGFSSNSAQTFLKGASLNKVDGMFVIHIKGSPFQRGFQHGYLLKKYIYSLYRDYFLGELLKTSSKSNFKRWLLLQYFKFKAKRLEKYIPFEFRQEMQGIAKGSGLPYNTILLMHTFLDTMPLLRKIKKTCTNFVFLQNLTEENKLFHGRNLGFSPRKNLFKNRVIFFIEPEEGFPFVSIGWPGMVGVLTGMNTNQISVGETGVGTADLSKEGTPIMFLLRKIIQYSPDSWYALREISKSNRICGYTITITDGKTDEAFVAEVTAKKYEIIFPENDYLIAVNHYLTKRLFETMKPVYPDIKLEDTGSYKRLLQFRKAIDNNKQFNLEKTLNLLKTPPIGKYGETLQSVLFIPEDLKFYFILHKKILSFSLEKEFGKNPLKFAPNPFVFLEKNTREILPVLKSEEDKIYYKKLTFVYESKLNLKLPSKDIFIYVFLPKRKEKLPCLFFLPHSGGVSKFIEENLGKFLAKNGFIFLTLESGAKKLYSSHKEEFKKINLFNKAKLYTQLIEELSIEGRNVLHWIEKLPFIDKEKIALGGLSLGAIISETLVGMEDKINAGIFLLGGADFKTLVLRSQLFKKYRTKLKKSEINQLLEKINFLDPLNFSFKTKNKNILMINALFDKDMPKDCTLSFWRSLEYPPILWLPEGHFTSYLSFGYVENKILEFLNFNLMEKKKTQRIKRLKLYAPTGEKAHLWYEHKNFKLKLGGKYSSYEKRLKLGFEKEEIFNSVFFGGISLKSKWESDTRYNLKGKIMYDLYIGTQFTQTSKIYLGFSSYNYNIYDLDPNAPDEIKNYYGKPKVNFLTLKLLRNTTNDKIYPAKGSYLKIESDISSEILDSDFDFYRIKADYRHYYDLNKDKVFVFRTKWGYLDSFGQTQEVPFFEKFYIGGSSTVRGYKGKRVGVLDNDLLPLGGDFFGVFNLEFRFPIYRKFIYGATFFDTGFLVKKISQLTPSKFRSGTGLGLRIRTKWGFIKIDYGIKVGYDENTSRSRLHIGVGLPF